MQNFNKILIWIVGFSFLLAILYMALMIVTDPGDNLVVAESFITTDSEGDRVVRGTVANMTYDKSYSNVAVLIEYKNVSGDVIDSITMVTEVLPPQKTFEFETEPLLEDVEKFNIVVSSPDNERPKWLEGSEGK